MANTGGSTTCTACPANSNSKISDANGTFCTCNTVGTGATAESYFPAMTAANAATACTTLCVTANTDAATTTTACKCNSNKIGAKCALNCTWSNFTAPPDATTAINKTVCACEATGIDKFKPAVDGTCTGCDGVVDSELTGGACACPTAKPVKNLAGLACVAACTATTEAEVNGKCECNDTTNHFPHP